MKKELSELARFLSEAKDQENHAKQNRIEIEEQIASLLQGPPEGSVSDKDDHYKVTVTRAFRRTLDLEIYTKYETVIPPDLNPITMSPKIDLTKLRAIQTGNPSLYKLCTNFIITKPAKTSVSVKEVR